MKNKNKRLSDLYVEGEIIVAPKVEGNNTELFSFDMTFPPSSKIKVVTYDEDVLEYKIGDRLVVQGPCAFDRNNTLVCGANLIIPVRTMGNDFSQPEVAVTSVTKEVEETKEVKETKEVEQTKEQPTIVSENVEKKVEEHISVISEEDFGGEIYLDDGVFIEDIETNEVISTFIVEEKTASKPVVETQEKKEQAIEKIEEPKKTTTKTTEEIPKPNNEFGLPLPGEISLFGGSNKNKPVETKKETPNVNEVKKVEEVKKPQSTNTSNTKGTKRTGKFTLDDLVV